MCAVVHNNHLSPRYQPVLDLRWGSLEGYEALVRWVRGEQEVSPGLFIPLAEEGSLIHTLDVRVLERGLGQLRQWSRLGAHPMLSLNLSSQSLHRPGVVAQVEALLGEFGIDLAQVMLEITETSLIADPERSKRAISEFQALGLRVAIDDFGSGYASLGYLRQLPINRLKVDKSLDLEVLAEGIETKEQLERLTAQGFD